MRVLLLGKNGQVGREIEALMKKQPEITCVALTREQLDLVDHTTVATQLSPLGSFDWIINAAAYTAVDKAETDIENANAVNHLALRAIADYAKQQGSRVLHFSTDYVFDGNHTIPYVETDIPNPINVYGQTKLAGEKALQECLPHHWIIRTSWVFSTHGHNFLKTMLRLLQSKTSLNVVADQQGIPTAAKALAELSLAVIQKDIKPGIYHYTNEGATTWHGFASYIADSLRKETNVLCKEIRPIKAIEYPTPAKRPAYSILNTNKIQAMGIPPKPWQSYVDVAIKIIL